MVYFITDGEYFKIGFTTNTSSRIVTLQTSTHRKLVLFRELHGGFGTENWFHRQFDDNRVINEWFSISEEDIDSKILEYELNKPSILKEYNERKSKQLKMCFNSSKRIRNRGTVINRRLSPKEIGEIIHQGVIIASVMMHPNVKIGKGDIVEYCNTSSMNSVKRMNKHIEPRTVRFLEDENSRRYFIRQDTLDKYIAFENIYDEDKSLNYYVNRLNISKSTAVEFRNLIKQI